MIKSYGFSDTQIASPSLAARLVRSAARGSRSGGTGVKWEELLVVDGLDAYWLDDQVPHLSGTGQSA